MTSLLTQQTHFYREVLRSIDRETNYDFRRCNLVCRQWRGCFKPKYSREILEWLYLQMLLHWPIDLQEIPIMTSSHGNLERLVRDCSRIGEDRREIYRPLPIFLHYRGTGQLELRNYPSFEGDSIPGDTTSDSPSNLPPPQFLVISGDNLIYCQQHTQNLESLSQLTTPCEACLHIRQKDRNEFWSNFQKEYQKQQSVQLIEVDDRWDPTIWFEYISQFPLANKKYQHRQVLFQNYLQRWLVTT